MAACLITVTGTSGVIRINYTISAIPYSIETSIGSFYIDDTATDVTYTTLSGDLIATDSGCLTPAIADLPANCYEILWKDIRSSGYIAEAILLGMDEITITDTNFPDGEVGLSINNADDDRVKVIGYKTEQTSPDSIWEYNYYYILKVLGSEIPILRVRNADDSGYIYIYGVLQADCLPKPGYNIIDPCYSSLPPAP